jgi:hypothetical protein
MNSDRLRPTTSFPDKMGTSPTTVLHGVRARSIPPVCTVRARAVRSRSVLGRERDVSVGPKPLPPSNAVEVRVGALIFSQGSIAPHRPQAVQAAKVSHAESK